MRSIYNNEPDIQISGNCGVKHVSSFSEMRCPVCSEKFMFKALDISNQPEHDVEVMCRHGHTDDAGIHHVHAWGRSMTTHHDKIHMFCPNKCVEEIIFNVENTTYGHYRELTEMEQHYVCNS